MTSSVARVQGLLQDYPLIDGHNDLPIAYYDLASYDLDKHDLSVSVPKLHTDLPRLRVGQVAAQFWSLWVPQDADAVRRTFEQVDFVHRMVARYPDSLQLAVDRRRRRSGLQGAPDRLADGDGGRSLDR